MQQPVTQRPFLLTDTLAMLVFALALAADQFSKALVREGLRIGESVPAEGFFRLTHVTNSGAIFGLFPNQAVVMTAASVVGIGVLLYFYHAHAGGDWRVRVSMGLLLGGAVGNLIDRLVLGRVTDFLDVGAWPVFNLADSSIVTGVIILAVVYLFPNFLARRRESPQALTEDAAPADANPDAALSTGGGQPADDD
ncbi:MAG: signal peptidase II [Chloroflexi bacterium]|nr:signal peptidase II [Chloroflexota bacterium]